MTTGTTEHIDATTAAKFIPAMWSKKAIVAREEELVFDSLVYRQLEEDAKYGDTIYLPNVSNLSVQTKSRTANAATIFETVTETQNTVSIGTWQYNGIAIETATQKQVDRDLLAVYAPKQGYALAHAVDETLAGLIDDLTQTVGTLGVGLTYKNMLRANQYLDDANALLNGRAVAISPAERASFMELDEFIHRDYDRLHGDVAKKALNQAYIGTWIQNPTYVTTNVEGSNAAGHDNGLWQKDAIALVMQMKATTRTQFDINYMAFKVVVEQLYGTAELRDDHGVWLKGL